MNSITADLILLNSIQGFGYKKLQEALGKEKDTAAVVRTINPSAFNIKDIEKEWELIKEENVDVISIFDKEYPAKLKEIYSPPIILYVKGKLNSLCKNRIAIVGSRNCTHYGKNMARRISSSLATMGVVVVSGMARGIDTVAHKQTLQTRGETIAVLGSGLKCIYPSENKVLSKEISLSGCLISEFPMTTPPLKENFPRRNRIISGLSKATVVVQAPKKSGALITADFALEQGREVFAVPGNADSPHFQGCNNLIKQGAKLIDNGLDIVEEVFPELLDEGKVHKFCEEKDLSNISTEGKKMYELLTNEPTGIDTLTETLNLNSQQALSSLLHLELAGLVKQLPGKLYVKG